MSRPYKTPTYSQRVKLACIDPEEQAKEYALWLMKNNRTSCAVYPLGKTIQHVSNRFRAHLEGFHRGPLQLIEVNPADFLGKLDNTNEVTP